MKEVEDIQKNYIQLQSQFGQLKLAKIRIDKDEDKATGALYALQEKEKAFLDKITEKYGQGNLNPETGVFTPVESENNSK